MVEKNSQTAKNLRNAFAGESQARNRYTFYAEGARAEGLDTTAELFDKLARNEEQHAKFWFKYIRDFSETETNLEDAIAGEHGEWTDMYMTFALQAKDEGYDELALMFERVAGIEKTHEKKFVDTLRLLRGEEEILDRHSKSWFCQVCGHIEYADDAPDACTVCKAERSFILEV